MRELWLQMWHDIHPDAKLKFVTKGTTALLFTHHQFNQGISPHGAYYKSVFSYLITRDLNVYFFILVEFKESFFFPLKA